MLERNPASFVQPPKEPAKEMAILNESQVSQLLVAAQGPRWEALFHLAVISGMRQMELLGLKWSDLDWIRQTLKIERQLLNQMGKGLSSPLRKLVTANARLLWVRKRLKSFANTTNNNRRNSAKLVRRGRSMD